jgi:hypothetical protein
MDWVTRARPHVDRCASAWLVRRFVDPGARFVFVAKGDAPPDGATPFDMPGVELGHRGRACTFETMLSHHGLGSDAALAGIAALVHDLDFRELKLPESPGLDAVLQGLVLAEADDHRVLERAAIVFDALYARERARVEADA